jgi:hydrogenase maturation factor HypE
MAIDRATWKHRCRCFEREATVSQETYHQHEMQKEKHVEDHIGDEIRKVKEQEEREAHGFHEAIGDEIAHEKKAERRQQNETDAALTETADTILRGE